MFAQLPLGFFVKFIASFWLRYVPQFNTIKHYPLKLGVGMYLKKSRCKNGRVFLSISEGYRKDGKSRNRTVEKCGYLDVLKEQFFDPIAHFTARAEELTAQQRVDNEPITLEFHPKEKIDMRTDNTKNIGYAPLSAYYHALEIDKFWDNRRMRGDFKYNPNAVFKLLAYSRVLSPESKARTFANKAVFIDRMDFSLDDTYRALSFFSGYERDLVSWIDKKISALRSRDTTCIYYDVTNYYFEIDQEDSLRRRGVSKEHRPNPIVQMGLSLDSDGIPMSYSLYEGNINDCVTLLPAMRDLKAGHKAEHIIMVADKGLNTSDNIVANVIDGNGFVFSQSVRRADKKLKDWVLEQAGYTKDDNFKIKDRLAEKNVTVTCPDGKKKKEQVTVREVAFWSRDFCERSRKERAAVIEKSRNAIARGDLAAAKAHSSVRYVKDTPANKTTGEIAGHVFSLDEAKIANDELFDGYYCIITNEIEKTASEIIDIYRGLWRIEETFRVTKSTLEARPIYLSRHDRIHAHFLICYVALVLLRLIQADLGWKYSADAIAEAMASMTGVMAQKNYYLFGYRTELTDELGKLCGIDLAKRILSAKQMRDILASTKKS
jgi:hypothetical protein